MSSVGHMLFGYGRRDPEVVNSTPQAYQDMAGGLASQLTDRLRTRPGYTGPYTAGMTGGEQQGLGQVQDAAQNVGQTDTGQNALMRLAYNPQQQNFSMLQQQQNPFSNPNFLQQMGLRNITQQAYGQNTLGQQAQGVVGQQLGGVMNPFAGAAGMTGAEQMGLGQVGQSAFGYNPMTTGVNSQLMNLSNGGGPMSPLVNGNPLTDQLIASAQRPILNNFSDQALQQRGLYTGAGQQIQGEGSSPFAMASARLAEGTRGALNDAALGVTNQSLQQQLQAAGMQQQGQLQALGMAQQQPGMQLQNQLAGLQALGMPREIAQLGMNNQAGAFNQMQQNQLQGVGLSDQLQGNALQRALSGFGAASSVQQQQATGYENAANRQLQGFDSAQGRQLQANEGAAGRQLQAGQALSANDLAQQQAQLQAQLQNLQAQGLPRLIQQQGINAGLGQFNTQQNQILQLMQLMGQLSGPNTNVLQGMASENGAVQQAGNSFMQGFGSAI